MMDELVKQAMAKWPNVPHCYGWLALDARGQWRMRDEAAQRGGLAGDKLAHAALIAFIARNYGHDERGRWFFQNGPQRVYVDLEATPFIARTGASGDFVLHTGAPLATVDAVLLCPSGELVLCQGAIAAQLDDRDMAQAMAALELDGAAAGDEALLAWLGGGAGALSLRLPQGSIAVQRVAHDALPARFAYDPAPAPD